MDTVEQLIVDNKVTAVTKPKKRAIVSRKIVSTTDRPRASKGTKPVKSSGCNSCAARKMARLQNAQIVQHVQPVQSNQ